MKAYISLGRTRKATPFNFTGKLIKKVDEFFSPFDNTIHEVWETNQNFEWILDNQKMKTNLIDIEKQKC